MANARAIRPDLPAPATYIRFAESIRWKNADVWALSSPVVVCRIDSAICSIKSGISENSSVMVLLPCFAAGDMRVSVEEPERTKRYVEGADGNKSPAGVSRIGILNPF